MNYYSNLFRNKNNLKYKKKLNNNSSCGNEKSNELYMKGIQDMKRKAQIYYENQVRKAQEYKNYPFKPKIRKNYSSSGLRIGDNNKLMKDDFYKKNKEWKNRVENKIYQKRKNMMKLKIKNILLSQK